LVDYLIDLGVLNGESTISNNDKSSKINKKKKKKSIDGIFLDFSINDAESDLNRFLFKTFN